MQIPSAKYLAKIAKVSMGIGLIIGSLATWQAVKTIDHLFTNKPLLWIMNPNLTKDEVAIFVFISIFIVGIVFLLAVFLPSYTAYSISYYGICSIACPEIKPFVSGLIGPESILKTDDGQEFKSYMYGVYVGKVGPPIHSYLFSTGLQDVDHYICQFARSKDFTLLICWLLLVVLAVLVFRTFV